MGKKDKRDLIWLSAILGTLGLAVFGLPVISLLFPQGHKSPDSEVLGIGLASAVENYYWEYNRLPEVDGKKVETSSSAGIKLLEILLALETQDAQTQNSRSIVFFQAPEAKGGRGGIEYVGNDSVGGLYDSFGNPFTVVMNTGFVDTLEFEWGGKPVRLRGKQVAVMSVGKDGVEGTKDDVKTWE
ncbi:MAG: hypothetical protein AAGB14_09320 [Verrucomicrobiota bacterium]